ncbi:energy-coupling factor ABC transporter ATP-binding protein [Pyrococcus abyssi]|uniref:Putative ABC transporter ATP-binding protein PYRAB03730 n=1 Tax=Pyrococcus abyssi (strain GE5 / Orsay) TaxID=272844 RepID=Y373_PYRAB|nr:ATP-binding cassette domain-containing protein [Pyrococcus abyssi]Q9V1Q4.1 RecName: Full=Putative ABC transporter ATP-binding protein PYRAB03730 [Pyrococcus abyssi GE5]CAB49295.1 ABC ABC-type transport system, ATPase component, substrate unknown [Pyrococcus abyssi GE5]CCE69750.1 TPA: ABC transporter, ATP-binding protein [Pyrococcus abyssi GE5]
MNIIEVENVSFKYGNSKAYSLRDVNLNVKKGEFLGIIGPSGSGKSTFCLTLNGLIPHSINGEFEGNVFVDGLNTREHSVAELSTRVGLVFQNPDSQLFNMTVLEEVAFALENLGVEREEMWRRIRWALKLVKLWDKREEFPPNLSGGEKQRLAIASVLVMKPKVLVLDEPTSQLDPLGREEVLSLVRLLNKEEKITIILVEHNTDFLLEHADRIVVFDGGRVVMEGKPEEVFENVEFLERIGIRIPTRVKIGYELKKRGITRRAVLSYEEIIAEIAKQLR